MEDLLNTYTYTTAFDPEELDIALLLGSVIWIFTIIIFFGILFWILFNKYNKIKKQALELQLHMKRLNESKLQEKLLDKVKEKINLTQRSNRLRKQKDELIASVIYKQEHVLELGEEIKSIYATEYNAIQSRYPQLTELDMLVICLLGIDMTNEEICELLKMEKRTLYRRRQLISQRIGISSTELEDFAHSIIEE
ncbi:MAG: hypothetical protein MJZ65_00725 [Paludibacteraceae bacterium]|nr:hypothetical protein [Paludibacteraceae bacterium]